MPGPLVVSIVASVVLTIVLNLALRLFPGIAERLRHRLDQAPEADEQRQAEAPPSNVRVIVPWKLMLIDVARPDTRAQRRAVAAPLNLVPAAERNGGVAPWTVNRAEVIVFGPADTIRSRRRKPSRGVLS